MNTLNNPANGSALTPPMGWNSFNTFGCEPNEDLIKGAADAMVSTGLKAAGYMYINIDDGWMMSERDSQGNLVPDPAKFPNGLKVVTDYVHSKGLKVGIYLGAGIRTYGEKPGSFGFDEKDAKLVAELGFDLLKYDYRELPEDPPGRSVQNEYLRMRDFLAASGRPILLSICEHGSSKPWEWGAEAGQMWRTSPDIKDGFDGDITWGWGFNKIIDQTNHLYPFAGPGHWNDPDMLIVGLNGKLDWQGPGCTEEEYRSHFALWCLSAAPLLIGCDIRAMDEVTRSILFNHELIAVNQDALGQQGHIVRKEPGLDIWVKPLTGGVVAVGLYNRSGTTSTLTAHWQELGLAPGTKAQVRDLWAHKDLGIEHNAVISDVPAHGIAVFKLTPVA